MHTPTPLRQATARLQLALLALTAGNVPSLTRDATVPLPAKQKAGVWQRSVSLPPKRKREYGSAPCPCRPNGRREYGNGTHRGVCKDVP